jgi:HK97 family phage major capsid protein
MAKKIAASGKAAKDMTLRELQHRYGEIWHGEMNDRSFQETFRDMENGKDVDQEKRTEFEKWDKELSELTTELKMRKRDEELELIEARKGPKIPGTDTDSDEKYDPAFQPSEKEVRVAQIKFAKRGFAALTPADKKIVSLVEREERAWLEGLAVGFDPARIQGETRTILENRERRNPERPEQRAQSVTTTAGGYLIPEGFISEVIKYMKYISPFFEEFSPSPTAEARNLFNFRRTNSGNNIPWPTYDDTSNTGELLGINTTIGSATDMVVSRIVLGSYKYSSKPILVPYELFEDEGVGLNGLVSETLATRIARIANTHFTTGDNSAKPQGIVIGATSGKVSASATAVTFPEILDLEHSVDPSYRKRPTCRFMLHDSILLYLKKLTVASATNNARPLWAPGYDVGAPATIDGFQYVINQDMASSVATNSKIILFGDMKAYAVRMVNDVRAYKLEERYRDLDQTGFVSFIRLDGRTLNTAAIKYLRTT